MKPILFVLRLALSIVEIVVTLLSMLYGIVISVSVIVLPIGLPWVAMLYVGDFLDKQLKGLWPPLWFLLVGGGTIAATILAFYLGVELIAAMIHTLKPINRLLDYLSKWPFLNGNKQGRED